MVRNSVTGEIHTMAHVFMLGAMFTTVHNKPVSVTDFLGSLVHNGCDTFLHGAHET